MKDERNHHGAVDKSFSERICIVDTNYIRQKNWTAELGLTASRQAGDRNTGELGNF